MVPGFPSWEVGSQRGQGQGVGSQEALVHSQLLLTLCVTLGKSLASPLWAFQRKRGNSNSTNAY